VSYGPLLRSLAATPKGDGDNYATVAGTLLRQAFNEGRLPSQRRFIADLRSVGWGGRDAAIGRVYNIMVQALALSTRRDSQNLTNLDSFNKPPPRNWRKEERATANQWINHAVIVTTIEGFVNLQLWGSPSKQLITVFAGLSDNRNGYQLSDRPGDASGFVSGEGETFVTLEYAGVRHLVKR